MNATALKLGRARDPRRPHREGEGASGETVSGRHAGAWPDSVERMARRLERWRDATHRYGRELEQSLRGGDRDLWVNRFLRAATKASRAWVNYHEHVERGLTPKAGPCFGAWCLPVVRRGGR